MATLQRTKFPNLYTTKNRGLTCYYGRITISGISYRENFGFVKEKEALALLSAWEYSLKTATAPTLNEYYKQYTELYKDTVALHTQLSYEGAYRNHVKPVFGSLPMDSIKHNDAQKFVNDLLKTHSPKTVKNVVKHISTVYNRAKHQQYVTHNPFEGLIFPKFDNTRELGLDYDELNKFIVSILSFPEPLYRALFVFLLHGRRKNEALTLLWSDIDFNARTYKIRFQNNKARRAMSYGMTNLLFNTLVQHRLDSDASDFDYVFTSIRGGQIQDLRKAWSRFIKHACFYNSDIRLHDMRKVIGTLAINHTDATLDKVAMLLGHTNTNVTSRYVDKRTSTSKGVMDDILENAGVHNG